MKITTKKVASQNLLIPYLPKGKIRTHQLFPFQQTVKSHIRKFSLLTPNISIVTCIHYPQALFCMQGHGCSLGIMHTSIIPRMLQHIHSHPINRHIQQLALRIISFIPAAGASVSPWPNVRSPHLSGLRLAGYAQHAARRQATSRWARFSTTAKSP